MLIKCPECKKEISDKSSVCINCGYPINEVKVQKTDNNVLLDLKETMEYLGLGQTKTRELMKNSYFSLRIGNRLYASKILLDRWITEQSKKKR